MKSNLSLLITFFLLFTLTLQLTAQNLIYEPVPYDSMGYTEIGTNTRLSAVPKPTDTGIPTTIIHERSFSSIQSNVAPAQSMPYGITMVQAPKLWPQSKGDSVRVAIMDTGIVPHEDLVVSGRFDFTGDRVCCHPHGTHVAGSVAAIDNGFGVVGVSPKVQLYDYRVLNSKGRGHNEEIAEAIVHAVKNGMHIVNLSLSGPEHTPALQEAINYAIDNGVIVVCAAGNEGKSGVGYPAKYPQTIAVGAVDEQRQVAPFSSWGEEVDITAPGSKVLSTYSGNGYIEMSGTSMAAPHVAGAIALLYEDGVTTQSYFHEALTGSAIDLWQRGFDVRTGWGLIDPPNVKKPHKVPPPKLGEPRSLVVIISVVFILIIALIGVFRSAVQNINFDHEEQE